jgi:hypothetical protein
VGALRFGGEIFWCGYGKPELWELLVQLLVGTFNKTRIRLESCPTFSTISYIDRFYIP